LRGQDSTETEDELLGGGLEAIGSFRALPPQQLENSWFLLGLVFNPMELLREVSWDLLGQLWRC
jgi:hypothetical protein